MRIKYYLDKLLPDRFSGRFIRHNRMVWPSWKIAKPESEVLVYYSAIPSLAISFSYFANILAKTFNARIKAFSSTRKGFPLSLFYWKQDAVFRSFNVEGTIRTGLTSEQKARKQKILDNALKTIKTKQDVFDFQLDGVRIGVDIYETYLRLCNKPTADVNDSQLFDTIAQGIDIFIFWQDYLKTHSVKAIVVSHDVYIHENILCKLGYANNIPVYLPNIRGVCFAQRPYSVHHPFFKNYPAMFAALSPEEQAAGLQLAEERLNLRFNGKVGVDMIYSTKSAFSLPQSDQLVLKKSEKTKILICSHCFYDNPQAYGDMLFVDFYEWICFLGKMSERTDYDWYIKMHPDPLPGTEEIIRSIIAKYPKITFLPPETSHLQLVSEGLNFILTAYGSVGHELAALGVQVVNAGYNPHIAYDFNWHPQTVKEYEQYLLNLPRLQKKINKKDIYEFYYVHYYESLVDDFFLKSYREYTVQAATNREPDLAVFDHFLDHMSDDRHRAICARVSDFIASGKPYLLNRAFQTEDRNIYEKNLS